ncbi:MAG: osmoprotectant transport system substrate-binding protein [Solirubrobacteraceae bacterium]|jgi:osmoprotectant transport system substrate-binding protein|nr:osmoprotectant transport system substrate-binding protein [Solirubrobacteraceae bacterium]
MIRQGARWVAALAAVATAIGLSACGGSGDDDKVATATTPLVKPQPGPPIKIGTKDFTEEFILGELYSQALRAEGFKVRLKSNIGASEVTYQALANGSLDMYPEYVGTLLSELANDTNRPSNPSAAYLRAKRFEERSGFTLLAPTPFSDSEALAVTPKFAKRHAISSIADLRGLSPKPIIGAPKEFRSRFEGLIGLEKVYGLHKPRFRMLDFGARYPSLDKGKADVVAVFTTERQLAGSRYVILDDPQGLFAIQHVAPIISKKALASHGPRLRKVIDAVSAKLTTAAMRRMNGAVDIDGRAPRDVAAEFLRSQALV